MINHSDKIALIVLAAGSSSRLGKAKQLLYFKGQTLLEHTLQICRSSNIKSKFIVLGNRIKEIKASCNLKGFTVVENPDWQFGMSSSMKSGIMALDEDIAGVIFLVSDQVFLTPRILDDILNKVNLESHQIINCKYQNGQGPPVYFGRDFFNDILKLSGDTGARSVVHHNRKHLQQIEFDLGHIDIDTQEDLGYLEEQ